VELMMEARRFSLTGTQMQGDIPLLGLLSDAAAKLNRSSQREPSVGNGKMKEVAERRPKAVSNHCSPLRKGTASRNA
jgi:hypothetical protein